MKLLIKITFISLFFINSSFSENLCTTAKTALEIASRIRNLSLKKSVPCSVENKEQIRSFLAKTIEEEIGVLFLEKAEKLYKKLNLIPKESNYRELLIKLYKEQVAGYYDNYKKRYVMASWIPASMQLPVAVHEQTHAIQDQYFDLTSFLDIKTMSTDMIMARQALVEGEASAVMSDYTNQLLGKKSLSNTKNINDILIGNILSLNLIASKNPETSSILQFMIFSYTSGLHFVHQKILGKNYDLVNDIYKNPPSSTEEILHPEKYLKADEKIEIPLALIEEKLKIGNKDILVNDTMGEFFISIFLEKNGIKGVAKNNLATGWAGDKLFLLKNNKLFWYLLFDTEKDRDEFIEIGSKKISLKKSFDYKQKKSILISY